MDAKPRRRPAAAPLRALAALVAAALAWSVAGGLGPDARDAGPRIVPGPEFAAAVAAGLLEGTSTADGSLQSLRVLAVPGAVLELGEVASIVHEGREPATVVVVARGTVPAGVWTLAVSGQARWDPHEAASPPIVVPAGGAVGLSVEVDGRMDVSGGWSFHLRGLEGG